jgi:hypothetical protein
VVAGLADNRLQAIDYLGLGHRSARAPRCRLESMDEHEHDGDLLASDGCRFWRLLARERN